MILPQMRGNIASVNYSTSTSKYSYFIYSSLRFQDQAVTVVKTWTTMNVTSAVSLVQCFDHQSRSKSMGVVIKNRWWSQFLKSDYAQQLLVSNEYLSN